MAEICPNVALILRAFKKVYEGKTLTDIAPHAEPVLIQAYGFMRLAHEGQARKGPSGRPYHHHPLMVFLLVRLSGGSLTEQIAALLHDTAEDMEKTWSGAKRQQVLAAIQAQFGAEVADLVAKLSNPENLRAANKKQWQATQLENHPEIRRIKVADKLASSYDDIFDTPDSWPQTKLVASHQVMVETAEAHIDVLSQSVQVFFRWLKQQEVKA